MSEFNDIDLVELSNKRKLDKLFYHIDKIHRTSNMNPNRFRLGLILKDNIYDDNVTGDRVYLVGNSRRKEFNFSYHKTGSELDTICNILNEMDYNTIWNYVSGVLKYK